MRILRRIAFWGLVSGLVSGLTVLAAPLNYYVGADGTYDERVPTPDAFFGFEVGEWHLRPDQIEHYFRALAAAAPERAKFEVFGHTHEQRALVHLVITSPDRLKTIATVQAQHVALSDPARSQRADLKAMPAVVNLGYSIHGNEASGANAAVVAAYWLVASESDAARAARRDLVVLVDPMFNPDGIARFAQWANGHRGQNVVADAYHREHREPWPSGRTNHYWFDLNRDWFSLVHPESQARAARFQAWKPNIMNDHHEMGTDKTYFFQPGVPTRNNPTTPERVYALHQRLAEFHAEALDKLGAFYYTKEGYDDFYVGKGSVYPDLQGGLGILYEQASARGHVQETDFGDLTFAFSIRNQVTTSLSTLAAAVAMRGDLLAHQREFYQSAQAFAKDRGIGGWVFEEAGDPARGWELRSLLAQHGIEVRALKRPVTIAQREYRPGESWVVPAGQAQARLIAELFTQRTEFEDTAFYDISAWSVPMAFNLPYAAIEVSSWDARGGMAGDVLALAPRPWGRLVGSRDGVNAYVLSANSADLPRALGRLGRAGVVTQVTTKPFGASPAGGGEQVNFGAGSIVIPVGRQPAKRAVIEATVNEILAQDAVDIVALNQGLSPHGPDLGSPSLITINAGRVAVLVGGGLSSYDAGEIWHTLDARWQMPVVLLEVGDIARANLARYDAIVMVDGTYSDISDKEVLALKTWTEAGGTLIAFDRAPGWAAEKLGVKIALAPAEGTLPKGEKSATEVTPRMPFGDGDRIERAKKIPGTIFGAQVDLTHPLAYGTTMETMPLFRTGTRVLLPSKSPYATPLVYADAPLLAGYAPEAEIKRLAGKAAAVVEPLGNGVVVAMVDNPVFRGYWFGGMRVLGNAIFFSPAMKPASGSEEATAEAHD